MESYRVFFVTRMKREGRNCEGKNQIARGGSNGGRKSMADQVTKSKKGTDIFSDIGFPPAEAENLRIRSAMMRALLTFIRDNKLTAAKAAKSLHVNQSRISELMRGEIHLFSIDSLVTLVTSAGLRIDLKVKKAA